jgi:hypothetical protein
MKIYNFNIEAESDAGIDSMTKEEWVALKDDLKAVFLKYKLDVMALYVYDVVDPKDLTEEERVMVATQQLAKKIAEAAIANTVNPGTDSYIIPNVSKRLN